MQQATTVVSCVSESPFFVPGCKEVLSLQIVRDWLACLEWSMEGYYLAR